MNFFKKLKILLFSLIVLAISLPAQADNIKDRLNKVGTGSEGVGYEEITDSGEFYFSEKAGDIIRIILSFLGVIFLLLIIYGGFLWMTAQGNDTQVDKAKKIIINSTIGITIVLLAYAITWFIIFNLGEATDFNVE